VRRATLRRVPVPEAFHELWRAMDGLFADVRATPWGAVITDGRFPRIWDANYARVDGDAPALPELEAALTPALRAAGADTFHVVLFDPSRATDLMAELSTRGHRLSWDLIMRADAAPAAAATTQPAIAVEELPEGAELWSAVGRSLELFGTEPGEAVTQLRTIETEVLAPGGKRWFGARDEDGSVVSVAALLLLAGVGYVDNVATEPRARGRGLASAITARVMAEAAAAGAREVYLLADPDDAPVVGMYTRLGYAGQARLASTKGPIPEMDP
jgi:ribosomal protein S18 acetylase RimI-like enzyme